MAYTPDPDRLPRLPRGARTFALTFGAVVCLFTFAPGIARALMGA